jgi:hypothetical protein
MEKQPEQPQPNQDAKAIMESLLKAYFRRQS